MQTGTIRNERRQPDLRTVCFESFGVRILIEVDNVQALEPCRQAIELALPGYYRFIRKSKADRTFRYHWMRNGRDSLYADGESIEAKMRREILFEVLVSQIRLAVAELAVGYVFVHAGVVLWNGMAIVLPASSGDGKTSLIVEMIKRGAIYYSDEFAVLDSEGFVHPFPKTLSIRRPEDGRQVEHDARSLGAVVGTDRASVELILFTKYNPGAKWEPVRLSSAEGVFELIRYTLPIRRDPRFVLAVLKKTATRAEFLRAERNDANEASTKILGLRSLPPELEMSAEQ